MRLLLLISAVIAAVYAQKQLLAYCAARVTPLPDEPGATVCVCNATYCDDIVPVGVMSWDEAQLYRSSSDGDRMFRAPMNIEKKATSSNIITMNTSVQFQTIFGFGGAMTDSSAWNIAQLGAASSGARTKLLRSYFAVTGIEYNTIRVPIGPSEFSRSAYSYNDHQGDFGMAQWALTGEDSEYKIPALLDGQDLSQMDLQVIGTPWSPPAWMKTTGSIAGTGQMKAGEQYWAAWGKYITKFAAAYANAGLVLSHVTVQNQPASTGDDSHTSFPALNVSLDEQSHFVSAHLGPSLSACADCQGTQVLALDDARMYAQMYAAKLYSDPAVSQYVAGLGVQWYSDDRTPPATLKNIFSRHPDKMILGTQANNGGSSSAPPVQLGSWARADKYAYDIMTDLSNMVGGWLDYNMVLDTAGGPSQWSRADAPIIVNATAGEFYKQPTFYAIGHFSKFVHPDAFRVLTTSAGGVLAHGFVNPGGQRVMVILNRQSIAVDLSIADTSRPGDYLNIRAKARSITSIAWLGQEDAKKTRL